MRLWKNKTTGKIHLVHEQWEPLTIKFDETLFHSLGQEVKDMIGDAKVASGTLMQVGWLIRGSGHVWIGLPTSIKDQFEDMGEADKSSEYEYLKLKEGG